MEKIFSIFLLSSLKAEKNSQNDFSRTHQTQPITAVKNVVKTLFFVKNGWKWRKLIKQRLTFFDIQLTMVRVKSFLGCLQLETGGLFLGWLFFVTFFLITSFVIVLGVNIFNSTREFERKVSIKLLSNCLFSASFLYSGLAWHRHFPDNRRVLKSFDDSRNKDGNDNFVLQLSFHF